jgi:hypothetical protein
MKARISDKAREILSDEELSGKVLSAISKGQQSTSVQHGGMVITIRRASSTTPKNQAGRGREVRGG